MSIRSKGHCFVPPKNLERLNSSVIEKTVSLNFGIRERLKMISDWRFQPGARSGEDPVNLDFNDDSWEQIHLPHDFVSETALESVPEVEGRFSPFKYGWYRKTFDVPHSDKGKNLWVDFDGIYGKSDFWFNGRPLGSCLNGYIGIQFDITDLVRYGEKNNITVYVDAQMNEGQWREGGGIHRSVWLNKSDYLRVAPAGVFVSATIPDGETNPVEAEVEIRTKILNGFQNALSFTTLCEIQDSRGNLVLSFSDSHTIGIDTFAEVVKKVKLHAPILWSLENPHLYRLITQLKREGEIVDGVTTEFGIRSIRFDEYRGFFLNGQSVKIKGTCNREDFAGIGIALPDGIISHKLKKLKEVGSNAYRSIQHPPSIELLNECDRLGMLVVNVQPLLSESGEDVSRFERMVLRDRNHPCVILWSLCNGEGKQETDNVRRIGEIMKDVVLKHDSTRPIVCATNIEIAGSAKITDIQGIDSNISECDPFHAVHPHMPIYGSKLEVVSSTRGIYENNLEKGYLTPFGVAGSTVINESENEWKFIEDRPFVLGGFVWTGFDYLRQVYPLKKNNFNFQNGFMDVCGFPKDIYYYYQSWWSDKKVLHLFPHWNWQSKEGQEIEVWCYSNCENVELLLNEKSQGVQKMPRNGHLSWKVKYHPGSLRAIGSESGKVIIETVLETASSPIKIRLKACQLEMVVGGADIIPVEVEVLDWKNRLVPLVVNEVVFHVKGPGIIVGVENGDPASYKSSEVQRGKFFNGRCLVLVRTIDCPGEIKITAKSKGLRNASIVLKSF